MSLMTRAGFIGLLIPFVVDDVDLSFVSPVRGDIAFFNLLHE